MEDVFDGQTLLDATNRLNPDLIVVDVFMPVLSGIEAVQRLKALASRVAVVFITTDGGQETIQQALETGARGFVRKASAAEETCFRRCAGGAERSAIRFRQSASSRGSAAGRTKRRVIAKFRKEVFDMTSNMPQYGPPKNSPKRKAI